MTDRPTTRPRSTINDVAAAAGVSRQTVTRAMNNLPGINAATKDRVLAAAKRLHYRPSRFGRGLVNPEPRTLGLVLEDLTNPYYPELASAVIGEAAKRGWNVLFAETIHATERAELLAELTGQVDAILSYPDLAEDLEQLADLPYVQLDSRPGVRSGVELDYAPAMAELVDHLLAKGVRHPVLLDRSAPGQISGRGRCFQALMRQRKVDPPVIQMAKNSLAGGMEGSRIIINDHPETDAIMAFNDMSACGTLKTLRRAGIDVPSQIRVAGFDGLRLGTYVSPELTTLALDVRAVAEAAVELAIGLTSDDALYFGAAGTRRIAYRLVIREST